jgi:hypothetical protein
MVWSGDLMPKGKTKTSLIKAKNTGFVPAICISKPPGVGCLLQKYDCSGKFAGIIQAPADTLEGCQAAAQSIENAVVVMVWNNTGQKQFITETFDNCAAPPPPAIEFSQPTSTLIEDEDYYATWQTVIPGAYNVSLETGQQIGQSQNNVVIDYYWQKFSGEYFIFIYIDNAAPDPTYYGPGWPAGTCTPF